MKNTQIHIVGGGIIGLCTAFYLKKEGWEVTVFDKGDLSDGTSFGNAGMIVPSHFVPMATPEIITKGLKWLLNNKSPFYIKPRLNAALIQWLWHFYHSATPKKVNQAMPLLYALNEKSKELYREIAQEEAMDFGYEEKGLLMLYKTAKQAKAEEQLARQAGKLGIRAELYDQKGLNTLEPNLELNVLGGVYFPGDAHLSPNQLMKQLLRYLQKQGVQFKTAISIIDFKVKGSKIEALLDERGNVYPVEKLILTAGSWTGHLLKKVGLNLHLQDGKGYSITTENTTQTLKIPTILTEAKVALTPMGDGLRIGGTLELSGWSNRINRKRVQGIVESIPKYYNNLPITFDESTNIWKGYRPCSPDGLPYIGRAAEFSNLFVGTGHGMMGLSLGAVTGKILSELLMDQKPMMDIAPFGIDRFK
ncbi:MAG: FAD-dependent oxidoreductase [Bacteroidota bacterium]